MTVLQAKGVYDTRTLLRLGYLGDFCQRIQVLTCLFARLLSSTSTSTFTLYVHDNTHERLQKGVLQVTLHNLLLIRS